MRFKFLFLFLGAVLLLSGCAEIEKFIAGDVKDDFCGAHLNFQYCKCAFHGDYCDFIGMSRREARKHVDQEYDKWVEEELAEWQEDCVDNGGIVDGEKCRYCAEGEAAVNGECVSEEGADEEDASAVEGCKYDSECEPVCEGNVAWKMGCDPRESECVKTFDTDCAGQSDVYGDLSFPRICDSGVCASDESAIADKKESLRLEKQLWSDTVKEINARRADINAAMLEANKNCINGIADMTNVAIIEFSTRIASVLAGGIPDVAAMAAAAGEKAAGLMAENMKNLAGAAVDYAGKSLDTLYAYQQGEPAEEDKKLKPHEYIKLNCDLYNYFKQVLAESDADLQMALDKANEADAKLNLLP